MRGLSIGAINIAAYQCLAAVWMPSLISGFQKKNIQTSVFSCKEGTQQDILQYLDERMVNGSHFSTVPIRSIMTGPLMKDRMVGGIAEGSSHGEKNEVFPVEACRYERFIMPEHGQDQGRI